MTDHECREQQRRRVLSVYDDAPVAGADGYPQLRDAHPVPAFDEHIGFRDSDHTYWYDGWLTRGSTTGFIHAFFEEFDAEAQAERCSRNRRNAKYYGREPADIVREWEENRDEAARLGTRMHLAIEVFYNPGAEQPDPSALDTREWQHFLAYHRDVATARGWRPYRTELSVFHPDYELGGQIDMVYRPPEPCGADDVILVDWKRSKEIRRTAFGNRCGQPPLEHMPDCNHTHYQLQLNIYKFVIEARTPLRVVDMYLARFHPDADSYELIRVPDLRAEVEAMVRHRRVCMMDETLRCVRAAVGDRCAERDAVERLVRMVEQLPMPTAVEALVESRDDCS